MAKEWKALELAGEEAGLNGEDLIDYVNTTTNIFNEKTADGAPFEDFDEEFINYLNNEILTDDRVTSFLRSKRTEPFEISELQTRSSNKQVRIDVQSQRQKAESKRNKDRSTKSRRRRSRTSSGGGGDLVVRAAVKDRLGDMHVAHDFWDALDHEVNKLLQDAIRRAQSDARETVEARDL